MPPSSIDETPRAGILRLACFAGLGVALADLAGVVAGDEHLAQVVGEAASSTSEVPPLLITVTTCSASDEHTPGSMDFSGLAI